MIRVRKIIKSEFIGIDRQIDQIIDSFQNWYLLPDSVKSPIVINLWGMTGVGKTSLVRRLVELLDLDTKFVEVDMREVTTVAPGKVNAFDSGHDFITSNLSLEGGPSVWLFDEIQRARTISATGSEIDRPLLSPLWALLSDGVVTLDHLRNYATNQLMMPLLGSKFTFAHALLLKQIFKLKDTPTELIEKYFRDPKKFLANLEQKVPELPLQWKMDFRKSVIFVSGNLDEAYEGVGLMDDDLASADELHEASKKVNLVTILNCLQRLFRREEIARLGSNHVIYPAWSSASYRKLIENHLVRFKKDFEGDLGVKIEFDSSVSEFIYNEGVIPSQGARPVLSVLNQLILANGPAWQLLALKQEKAPEVIKVKISEDGNALEIEGYSGRRKVLATTTDITNVRKKTDNERHPEPFLTRVARHEAAHAVVGIVLYKELPQRIKSRTNMRDSGGLVRFASPIDRPLSRMKDDLTVQLAGKAGEEMFFDTTEVSGGAENDLSLATELASNIVSKLGLGSHLGQSYISNTKPNNFTSFKERDDREAEEILKGQFSQAKSILEQQRPLWDALSQYMKDHTSVSESDLILLLKDNFRGTKDELKQILSPTDCVSILKNINGSKNGLRPRVEAD